MMIISVYAPTSNEEKEDVDKFYDQIQLEMTEHAKICQLCQKWKCQNWKF